MTSPGSWCTLSWLCRVLLGFLSSRKKKNASKKCPLIKEKRPISGWGVRKSCFFFAKSSHFQFRRKAQFVSARFFFLLPNFFIHFHRLNLFPFVEPLQSFGLLETLDMNAGRRDGHFSWFSKRRGGRVIRLSRGGEGEVCLSVEPHGACPYA